MQNNEFIMLEERVKIRTFYQALQKEIDVNFKTKNKLYKNKFYKIKNEY